MSKNRTEQDDSTNQPDVGIDSDASRDICPRGIAWCHRHADDGDYCWSRTIQVREAQLAISNGTQDGRLKLWGLGEFEDDAVHLDTARDVVDAIATLLGEVQG